MSQPPQENQSPQLAQPTQPPQETQSSQLAQPTQPTRPSRIDPPPGVAEVWLTLRFQNFPKYEVSTFGRIRYAERKNILKGFKDRQGYLCVKIADHENIRRNKYIHILVAIAFIPNPEGKKTVDHRDRIRDNNYVENLRWATQEEQTANRSEFQVQSRAIYQYSENGALIRRWDSVVEAAQSFGVTRSNIASACNGHHKTAVGYIWRYCDQIDILDGEEWRPIPYPEYPDVQASSFGRIKFPHGKISFGQDSDEYKRVTLTHFNTKRKKSVFIHRLVAAAFFGRNDDPNVVVNHKDGNKGNNRVDNLEYVTHKENAEHAQQLGLVGPLEDQYKRKVAQFDLNGNLIAEYESITRAAEQLGLNRQSIGRACSGIYLTSGRYKWKFIE